MSSNPLNSIELEQNCNHALKTCDFGGATGKNCASQFCNGFPATEGTCPQLGLDPRNCCSSSDAATCLGEWVHNGGGAAAATPNVCASVVSIIVECSSADPGLFPGGSIYISGPQATSLASCMCYNTDGAYDSELDGFASACVASGSAAHPTYYKYGTLLNNFCTDNAGPAGAAASTTPGSVASSSRAGETVVATTTNGPVVSATGTPAASTKSSQQGSTNSAEVGVATTKAAGPSSTAPSQSAAAAGTSSSIGTVKNALQMSTALLLGFSVLFSFY